MPAQSKTPRLLTRAEAAALLRVSLDGIDAMMRAPDPIPHLRAGRRYLFDTSEILDWARRQAEVSRGRVASLPATARPKAQSQ